MSLQVQMQVRRHKGLRKKRTDAQQAGNNSIPSQDSCAQENERLRESAPKFIESVKQPRRKPKSENPTNATLVMRDHLGVLSALPNKNMITKFLAIDCEFIATTKSNQRIARVSIVNMAGSTILDAYVEPDSKVKSYLTRWSGISSKSFTMARQRNVLWDYDSLKPVLIQLLAKGIVVGHAVHNDFRALKLDPKDYTVVDTQVRSDFAEARLSLKNLMLDLHEIKVQTGSAGHCSVEDAVSSMYLFMQDRNMYLKTFPAARQKFEYR